MRQQRTGPAREFAGAESVTVTLSSECLWRLLCEQELHVDEFSCGDVRSRESVRLMLLKIVSLR
ncbi:hypothetical protein [Marinobacter mobilis]|uniref:Uncharacterized protein n=1 Tax=Marinobacter mobilis TaxID=488533 RepID=A0A1H2ZMY9_9GAMM|nr:hypothetical protein [Marinobacter mobilis]SDX18892.1 hypothetical protein SAMN04487960_1073 [Marinobacter mobilis]